MKHAISGISSLFIVFSLMAGKASAQTVVAADSTYGDTVETLDIKPAYRWSNAAESFLSSLQIDPSGYQGIRMYGKQDGPTYTPDWKQIINDDGLYAGMNRTTCRPAAYWRRNLSSPAGNENIDIKAGILSEPMGYMRSDLIPINRLIWDYGHASPIGSIAGVSAQTSFSLGNRGASHMKLVSGKNLESHGNVLGCSLLHARVLKSREKPAKQAMLLGGASIMTNTVNGVAQGQMDAMLSLDRKISLGPRHQPMNLQVSGFLTRRFGGVSETPDSYRNRGTLAIQASAGDTLKVQVFNALSVESRDWMKGKERLSGVAGIVFGGLNRRAARAGWPTPIKLGVQWPYTAGEGFNPLPQPVLIFAY